MYLYVERIRDFLGYALYKFTFYLLTYLLTYNESPPLLINVAILPCKMKRSSSRYTTTPKRDKISQKQTSVSAYC